MTCLMRFFCRADLFGTPDVRQYRILGGSVVNKVVGQPDLAQNVPDELIRALDPDNTVRRLEAEWSVLEAILQAK